MDSTFITAIEIKKVRHLKDIRIPLSETHRKHLILTGKNGSGKTSVLEALKDFLAYVISGNYQPKEETEKALNSWNSRLEAASNSEKGRSDKELALKWINNYLQKMDCWESAVAVCPSYMELREKCNQGQFLVAFYPAERKSQVLVSENIERVELKEWYGINDKPGQKLVKYLVNMKTTQAFAQQRGNIERVEQIEQWFTRFHNILRSIFEDDNLTLDFNIDTFQFKILQNGRDPFDFNEMSSGYSAVFDIINDLIIRMEAQKNYNLEGIVLIDEIDTHLHLELQKKILPILTELFPNLQFLVTTHSPFILSSLENTVVYDLENKTMVENGLAKLPYQGIVEGYFGAPRMSDDVTQKFNKYKALVSKEELTDDEFAEVDRLEVYLDEIPDFLASDMAAEYSRLKLEFSNRF